MCVCIGNYPPCRSTHKIVNSHLHALVNFSFPKVPSGPLQKFISTQFQYSTRAFPSSLALLDT